jgi:coproporphyrinogen III oxidase-like Fe-S oxidoreductase
MLNTSPELRICSSKHNQGYWDGIEYLAFGPGASTLIQGVRTVAPKQFESYMNWGGNGFPREACEEDVLDKESWLAEKLFLQLRQAKGLGLTEVENLFHVKIPTEAISRWEKAKCVQIREGRLILIDEGWLLLDEIVADLLAKIRPG